MTYNPSKPQPSPFAGYPAGYVLQSLSGERLLYAGSEATVFDIVTLIPDLADPSQLTTYNPISGSGYNFDSQHPLTCLPQHAMADSCTDIHIDPFHLPGCLPIILCCVVSCSARDRSFLPVSRCFTLTSAFPRQCGAIHALLVTPTCLQAACSLACTSSHSMYQ